MSLADTLKAASDVAGSISGVGGPVGIVAQVAALAFRAGAAIAEAGKDPVVEIHRLLSPLTQLDAVRAEWNDIIEREFKPKRAPSQTDTIPAPPGSMDDIYRDI